MIDLMNSFPSGGYPAVYEGFVKFKLVHAIGRSIFAPDFVVMHEAGRWVWLEPRTFGAPLLSFHDNDAYAQFDVRLIDDSIRLLIGITNDRYIRSFDDGSHIYRCKVAGPDRLIDQAAGDCRQRRNLGFDLRLFHHTAPETLPLIHKSGMDRVGTFKERSNWQMSLMPILRVFPASAPMAIWKRLPWHRMGGSVCC